MKTLANTLCIILALILCPSSWAEYAISASELKLMPSFCKGLSPPNFQADAKHLRRQVHVPGQHTQHFCHGMKALVRADRAELKKKGGGRPLYNTAILEFEYVQSHSEKMHALIPSCSLYKAVAFSGLNNTGEAIKSYNKAISLKRKYPKAYAKLADYYIKLNQQQSALNTVKTGLKYSPKSKSLLRRLKKYTDGGNTP
mgnify:CR=1 FL=1